MNSNILVSVIVPVYRVERYLNECVESLVNQTYTNLEIILVDDGSPDDCPSMCDLWKSKDSRIIVVHKSNGGLSDARNAGIQVATGQWILFVDSDDVVANCFVERLLAVSQQVNTLAISGVVRFQDVLPVSAMDSMARKCSKDLADARGGMYACGALYSRELIDYLGLRFDPSLRNLEDVTWNALYLRYVTDVVYVDVPYYYRMNPTSITSRCSDNKWQVASWVAARHSIMNWFADKQLTPKQRKEVVGMYRHCQNNIYAECLAGNISYEDLKTMESEATVQFNESLVFAPERVMRNRLPRLYYDVYMLLMRVKNAIRK